MTYESIEEILQESKEISLDYSCIEQTSFSFNPAILILGQSNDAQEFYNLLCENHLQVFLKTNDEISGIEGHFGSYEISCQDQHFVVGQIVSFYQDHNLARLKGCSLASDFHNPQELYQSIQNAIEELEKKSLPKILSYSANRCQYHHRFLHEGTCLRCFQTCPSLAISADDEKRELSFFDIDCSDCGKCMGVCPSGAIQRFGYNQESLSLIAKLYSSFIPVISTQEIPSDLLPKDYAPLLLPNLGILNEASLLTLIQESSSSIVIYSSQIDKDLQSRIDLINQIFEKIFKQQGIYITKDLKDLPNLKKLPQFHYTYTQTQDDFNKKIFSDRLRFFVKAENYGVLDIPNHTYGKIKINESKCTLCNSCVGVCNTQSLITGNFEILHNPSLCTTCGYCTKICPENAIEEQFGILELQESWFEYQSLIKDEEFFCVECKKVFSNKKPIERVKKQMIPLLDGDALKIKSLECCSDCKVKIMFED